MLERKKGSSRFLLLGSRLKDLIVAEPGSVTPGDIGRTEDKDTMRVIELTDAQMQAFKNVYLR